MANEFDDIVRELGPELDAETSPRAQPVDPMASNEFDKTLKDSIADQREESKDALMQSSYIASKTNPDQFAEIKKKAEKFNIPDSMLDILERNPEFFDSIENKHLIDPDKMVDRYPKTTEFLSNPDNAKLALDDFGNLVITEDKFKEYGALSEAYDRFYTGMASLHAGLHRLPGATLQTSLMFSNMARKVMGMEQVEIPKDWIETDKAKFWANLAQESRKKYEELDGSIYDEMAGGNWAKAGRLAFMQATESFPTTMVVGLSALSGMGIGAGAFIAGGVVAGESYAETMDRDDVEPLAKQIGAFSKGAMEGLFEQMQILGPLKHWGNALDKRFGKKASAEFWKAFTKAWTYSIATEAGTEALTQVGQDVTDVLTGVNPDLTFTQIAKNAFDAGVVGGVMGGTTTAVTSSTLAAQRQHQLRQAQLAKDFYLSISDDAKASKARERLNKTWRDHADTLIKDGPIQNILIDAEDFKTYSQEKNIDPTKLANDLGILNEYTNADETGTPIKIPMPTWVDNVVDTEHFEGLANDIRLKEDALSTNQANELSRQLEQELKEVKEAEKERQEPKTEAGKQAKEIGNRFKDQLKAAGRSSKEAWALGRLTQDMFKTVAEVAGITPDEIINRYRPKILTKEQSIELGKKLDEREEQVDYSDEEIRVLEQSGFDIKRIEGTNVVDASAMFSLKKPIAQPQVEAPDIVGGEPPKPKKRGRKKAQSSLQKYLVDSNAQSLNEDQKESLSDIEKRFDDTPGVSDQIKEAQNPEAQPYAKMYSYRDTAKGPPIIPNFESKPTGVIGTPGIAQPFTDKNIDQLSWFDTKYKATLDLIKKHQSMGEPLVIHTSSDLIARDDYIEAMPKDTTVMMHLLTKDDYFNRRVFPGSPSRSRQDIAIEKLKERGIKVKAIRPTVESILAAVDKKQIARNNGIEESEVRAFLENVLKDEGPILTLAQSKFEPKFYLKSQQLIEHKMGRIASAQEVRGLLKDIKKEELKWIDIEGFLKGKDKVSKEDLLNHINATNLEIVPVVRGGDQDPGISAGDTVYMVFDPDGEGYATFISEDRAIDEAVGQTFLAREMREGDVLGREERMRRGIPESNIEFTVQAIEWDGESTLEDEAIEGLKPTKYSKYTLPGGENYREVLLTLPGPAKYKSPHWDETNVFAHVRMNDRSFYDKKKILFIEEMQSDWALDIKKKGISEPAEALEKEKVRIQIEDEILAKYKMPPGARNIEMLQSMHKISDEDVQRWQKARDEWMAAVKGEADFAFKNNWHEYALKRIIQQAAKEGYEQVAWTKGYHQKERYNLSKYVDTVAAFKNQDGTFNVEVYRGRTTVLERQSQSAKQIEELVGKDLTEKILNESGELEEGSGFRKYSGLDLEIGGIGKGHLYDKMLVSAANKIGKKYKTQVHDQQVFIDKAIAKQKYVGPVLSVTEIETLYKEKFDYDDIDINTLGHIHDLLIYRKNAPQIPFEEHAGKALSPRAAEILGGRIEQDTRDVTFHALDINEALAEAALSEGFPLFQKDKEGKRGRIVFGKQGIDIALLADADATTVYHELAHFFLEVYGDLSEDAKVNPTLKEEYRKILSFLDVTDRAAIGVEQHEKFARAFEEYLLEGKAPSEGLRSVFNQIKDWFLSVYKFLKSNNVTLNDEIRGVFDRMLASEKEIERNQPSPFFKDPLAIGMTPELQRKYEAAHEKAKNYAKDTLRAKLMQDLKKEQREDYKQLKESATKGWIERANEMPVYRLLSVLQDGIFPNGVQVPEVLQGAKLDKQALIAEFGEDILATLPKNTYAENGIYHDTLKDAFGFESSTEMLSQLSTVLPKSQFVANGVQDTLDQVFPEKLKQMLPEDTLEALYNDNLIEMRQLELEYLLTNNPGLAKQIVKKAVARPVNKKYVKQEAEKILMSMPLKDITPGVFDRAARRHVKLAGELLVKGDIAGAFEAKRKEQLNIALFQAAMEANQVQEQMKKSAKRFLRKDADLARSRDIDFINAGRKIIAHYELAPLKGIDDDPLSSVREYDPDKYEHVQGLLNGSLKTGKTIENITLGELVDINTALQSFWELSKAEKQIVIEGKTMDRMDAIREMDARINELGVGEKEWQRRREVYFHEKAANNVLSAKAHMTRVEAWVNAYDKDFHGPFRKYIWAPVNDAITKYRERKFDVFEKYRGILDKYKDLFGRKVEVNAHELDTKFNAQELMMVILHSGNLSNKDKLVRGMRWGEIDEVTRETDFSRFDAFFQRAMREGIITKRHMDLAQEVWDLMESMKPETQRAHKRIYGHYFSEITANEIKTLWGETYRGGYIPAIADPLQDDAAAIRRAKNDMEETSMATAFPSTGRGATMKRVQAYAAPLSLSFNILSNHIDWAMRFTYIQPAIKDVNSIVMNKEFAQSLKLLDDRAVVDMLLPWLQRSATQAVTLPAHFRWSGAIASHLRSNASLQIMSLNFANGLQQFTGLFISATKVKIPSLLSGARQYILNPIKTSQEIREMSPWMKHTADNNFFELQGAIKEIVTDPGLMGTFERGKQLIKKHGYFFQVAFQGFVNNVTWTGAFNEKIAEGWSQEKAVKFADSTVRLTQGIATAETISAFETGTPESLLFKQFISYFNMLANLQWSEYKRIMQDTGTPSKAPQLLYLYVMAHALPAIFSKALYMAATGRYDHDDPEEFMDQVIDTLFWSQAETYVAMLPYGQALNVAFSAFNDKSYSYQDRINMSPGFQIAETALKTPGILWRKALDEDQEYTDKDFKTFATSLGYLVGVPALPVYKRFDYISKVQKGEKNPEDNFEFMLGILSGTGK